MLALWLGCGLAAVQATPPPEPVLASNGQRPTTPANPAPALPLDWRAGDRLLVLAPHPDDEVIGCGGAIQAALHRQIPVRVVYLTNGDANPWSFTLYRKHPVLMPGEMRLMGQVRQQEAVTAASRLGLDRSQLTFLGYPDLRTLQLWRTAWNDAPACSGFLTRVRTVPYPGALRMGAPYKGEEVLADLKQVLAEFRPTKVLVSHPADTNGDHQALYLFTRVALWDLARSLQPELYTYLVHYQHWPVPPRGATAGEWLARLTDPHAAAVQLTLSPLEVDRKRQALLAHRSQYRSRPGYLMSFVGPQECFGALTTAGADGQFGLQRHTVRRDGNDLVVALQFARPIGRGVNAYIWLFGYRPDRAFGRLPKLQARLEGRTHALLDQQRPLAPHSYSVVHDTDQIVLRLPVQQLGQPDRLLLSIQSTCTEAAAAAASWRVVELASLPAVLSGL